MSITFGFFQGKINKCTKFHFFFFLILLQSQSALGFFKIYFTLGDLAGRTLSVGRDGSIARVQMAGIW